ncbi:MAG TPA: flagellar basal body rod protein FlgB [Desulfobulbus sp.]|nr:flagellar basal body rod protein FlgB [Desulfobulbus sp.]
MPFIQQFDPTLRMLQKVLDLRSENQQVISSNIANADTPGYAPATMEFEQQLHDAMFGGSLKPVVTRAGHIPVTPSDVSQVQGTITRQPDTTGIGDENGVSVDREMIRLAENEILYEAAVTMLNKKLAALKYVAGDGR